MAWDLGDFWPIGAGTLDRPCLVIRCAVTVIATALKHSGLIEYMVVRKALKKNWGWVEPEKSYDFLKIDFCHF
jgi:hypothetical protein